MNDLRGSVRGGLCIAAVTLAVFGPGLGKSWGAGWTAINDGLPGIGLGVASLSIDSKSTLYAVSAGSGSIPPAVFKSTDGGSGWSALSGVTGVNVLAIDPKAPSTLYAGTHQGVAKTTNSGSSWSDASNGLSSGAVTRIAIDPARPSTLYAVVYAFNTPFVFNSAAPVTYLFTSTDGGGNWIALETGLPAGAFIGSVVIDPLNPSTVYLVVPPYVSAPGTLPRGAILKSNDGGLNWATLETGLPANAYLTYLAVDPGNSSTLYALVPPSPATQNGGILKSTDGGTTWNALQTGLSRNASITTLAIHPTTPSVIYALSIAGPAGWSVLKSADGGDHWSTTQVSVPTGAYISSLTLDPASPSSIYLGYTAGPSLPGSPSTSVSGGVLKSTDGGESWVSGNDGLLAFDLPALAASAAAQVIYAGGTGGFYKSTDGGDHWSSSGLSAYTGFLLADSRDPNLLYAQTGRPGGCNSDERLLFRSTDGGANWTDSVSPSNSGCILSATMTVAHSAAMAINPSDPSKLYLAESDDVDGYSAILMSANGGANWTAAWDSFQGLIVSVRTLAIDPAHPATLYAGMDDGSALLPQASPAAGSSGLFKSADGGLTWKNTGLTSAVNLVAVDPSNSNIVYAAGEGHYVAPKGFQGVFKSTDGGVKWQPVNKGLESVIGSRFSASTALRIDPANPNVLYLGTSNGGVFRSVDGGANWRAFNDGLGNLQIRALALGPGAAHTLYAATPGGLFKISTQ